jgi:hypothetical protein
MLLMAATAHSGEAQAKKFEFGLEAGLNFATWTGDDVGSGASRRTGFFGGGVVTLNLSPSFALQSGVIYSQEGTGVDAGGGISGSFKVDYIRLPLYLRAGTKLQGTTPITPYLYAGPAVSFKVRCKIEASSGGQSAEADCDDPSVGAEVKSTDFAVHFGAGVGIGRFSIGGRYQLGLTSIDDSGADADVKNSVLAVSAGFTF